jgi:hypothetical protein
MASKIKTLTQEAMDRNNKTYLDYYDRLKLLSTSLFEYEGLDDAFGFGASRFLENALFEKGRASFIKDKEMGLMITNVNPTDKLNIYNLPTKVNCWSIGYNKDYKLEDVVYIMNNEMQKPTSATIELFAYRLYDIQRTMEVNLNAQRTPVLIEGDDKSILTLQNAYMQYSGNNPVLFANKNYNISDSLNVLNTTAPYLLDKLALYKHEVWNECMTYLGINNANTDKKQVVLSPEINANNELVNYYLNCFYSTRERAIDEVNEKFGLDIKLKINKNMEELLGKTFEDMGLNDKEEVNDGTVYN